MSDQFDEYEENPLMSGFDELHEHDIMKLFDELSFRKKWIRVFRGLKQPVSSGENKWARLQLLRLLSPLMAVVVPVLLLMLITVLAQFTPESSNSVQVTVVDPTPMEELEDIEQPEMDPLEPPDPIDMEFDVTMDAPSVPNEVAAPPAESASVQPAEFDSVAMVKSPVVMRGMLGSRNPGSQGAALAQFGGKHTVPTVLRALRWLAKNQRENGSWGETRVAMTSLALLAYLAHGDTPASEEFGTTVEKAIKFLISKQPASGLYSDSKDPHNYTQPIAAYALAEAYGLTKVPRVKQAAIKAIEHIVNGQNPAGSFDYNLKSNSTRNDLSYAGWCIQALKAANIAGISREVPGIKDAMNRAVNGVKVNFSNDGRIGTFGYTGPNKQYRGLTGVGVLCLQFLGESKSREVRMGLAGLDRWAFNWEEPPPGSILYYWYYITQAYFQEGGRLWDNWNKAFSYGLVREQKVIGKDESGYVDHRGRPQEIGSWSSPAANEFTGGNGEVMDTILCTLMLEVYYRYLPTFQQVPDEEIEEELGDETDLIIEIVSRRQVMPRG